jgi:hypothetical protein
MKSTLLIVTATVALFSALPQNASAHHSGGNTPKSHGNMTDVSRDQKHDGVQDRDETRLKEWEELHRKERQEWEQKRLLFLKRHHRNYFYEWEIDPFVLYPADPCGN